MSLGTNSQGPNTWSWLTRSMLDLTLVAAIGVALGSLLTPLEIASDDGLVDGWSRWVGDLHNYPLLDRLMVDVTSLGDELLLIAVSLCLVGWSYRRAGPAWARFFATIMTGGLLIDNIVKPFVGRTRPAFDQLVGGRGDSFPSGHVTAITALLLAVAFYAGRRSSTTSKKGFWLIAILGSALMAMSRVYVGVHWPTDVIAGMGLGATWTWMCAWPLRISPARIPWARRVYIPA